MNYSLRILNTNSGDGGKNLLTARVNKFMKQSTMKKTIPY